MIGTEPTLGVGAANTAELFVLLSPTGPYFVTGLKPVNLLADPKYVRAWPGGSGFSKMGSNYAPTLWISVSNQTVNGKLSLFCINFRLMTFLLLKMFLMNHTLNLLATQLCNATWHNVILLEMLHLNENCFLHLVWSKYCTM